MAGGRPTTYNSDIAAKICGQLSDGQSLRTVCKADDMPALSTIFLWLREYPEFSEQYAIAKDESADAMVEDMLDIADNQVEQPLLIDGLPYQIDGKPVMIKDNVSVNHAKLRVDTRKWAASKLKPKKYGERITSVNLPAKLSDLDEEELDRLLKEKQRLAEQSEED